MALNVRLDTQQALDITAHLKALTEAVSSLSENVAKWQAEQVQVTREGIAAIVVVLGGESDPEEVQRKINDYALQISGLRGKLQTAVDKQPKGD